MSGCLFQLLTLSYFNIEQISQHSMEITVKKLFCVSERKQCYTRGTKFFWSEIFKPICHHSYKAESFCCSLLLPLFIRLKGWDFRHDYWNTEFLRNSAAVLPMLYSVPASLHRQSFNIAVVKETMPWYLEYQKIWLTFHIQVFSSINHKTLICVWNLLQCDCNP